MLVFLIVFKSGEIEDHAFALFPQLGNGKLRGSGMGEEMGTGWFFNRYKASLDIFWLRDENLEESASFAFCSR